MEAMMELLLYALAIALYLTLIAFTLFSSAVSLAIGLVSSVFVGIFYAVKNCILSIHESVTNKFMKILLYITIGIVVLGIIGTVVFGVFEFILLFV